MFFSPLDPKGLDHYRFETAATVQMGAVQVARISVSPRRGRTPGLIGYLWIAVENAALVGYDLRFNPPAMARDSAFWAIRAAGLDTFQARYNQTLSQTDLPAAWSRTLGESRK